MRSRAPPPPRCAAYTLTHCILQVKAGQAAQVEQKSRPLDQLALAVRPLDGQPPQAGAQLRQQRRGIRPATSGGGRAAWGGCGREGWGGAPLLCTHVRTHQRPGSSSLSASCEIVPARRSTHDSSEPTPPPPRTRFAADRSASSSDHSVRDERATAHQWWHTCSTASLRVFWGVRRAGGRWVRRSGAAHACPPTPGTRDTPKRYPPPPRDGAGARCSTPREVGGEDRAPAPTPVPPGGQPAPHALE